MSEINAIIQAFKKHDLIIKMSRFYKRCLHIRQKKIFSWKSILCALSSCYFLYITCAFVKVKFHLNFMLKKETFHCFFPYWALKWQ